MKTPSHSHLPSRTQRGSVLLFSLITLTILMVSAVALVRSFNAGLFNAGNLAFKRDLTNQAERVWPIVYAKMTTTGAALATPAARSNHRVNDNYYAQTLPATSGSSKSIPDALLASDDTFGAVGNPGNDIDVPEQQVTIRYMVDRLCSTTGLDSALGASKCTLADGGNTSSGDAKGLVQPPPPAAGVVYRLSIRVTGPRGTTSFFQTTFSL